LAGQIEVDESYFGGVLKRKRVKRISQDSDVLFLKRGGRFYVKVVPDTKSKILMGIIQDRIVPESIVFSDGYHSTKY
jgi:transposase